MGIVLSVGIVCCSAQEGAAVAVQGVRIQVGVDGPIFSVSSRSVARLCKLQKKESRTGTASRAEEELIVIDSALFSPQEIELLLVYTSIKSNDAQKVFLTQRTNQELTTLLQAAFYFDLYATGKSYISLMYSLLERLPTLEPELLAKVLSDGDRNMLRDALVYKQMNLVSYENSLTTSPDGYDNSIEHYAGPANAALLEEEGFAPVKISIRDLLEKAETAHILNPFNSDTVSPFLYLRYRCITSVDGMNTCPHFGSLASIYLCHNSIAIIRPGSFEGSDIRTLSLFNNKIATLQPQSFKGLEGLRNLYLNYNVMTRVPTEGLSVLRNLGFLDLSNNHITALRANSFVGLNRLRELDLTRNGMRAIEPGSFTGLTSLRKLDLGYNFLLEDSLLSFFSNAEKKAALRQGLPDACEVIYDGTQPYGCRGPRVR